MNKTSKKLWSELLDVVFKIDEQGTSVIIFYKLRDWYQENKKFFSPNLIVHDFALETQPLFLR